jgi:A/G-specific adenine glycosylase
MMDLASSICTPREPRCLLCPIHADCRAAASGEPTRWPIKLPKRPRPTRHGTAWWIEAEGQFLTIVRPAKGLLGGMCALPSSEWGDRDQAPAPPLDGVWTNLGTISHGFTHFELVLDVQAIRLPAKPAIAGRWLNFDDIHGAGLPTLFLKAVILARAQLADSEA